MHVVTHVVTRGDVDDTSTDSPQPRCCIANKDSRRTARSNASQAPRTMAAGRAILAVVDAVGCG
jgi:hypothetical protein